MGLTDVLLPFLLIFSVIFAILSTIRLFSAKGDATDKNKNIWVVLSLAIALLVVVPHVTGTYPPGGDIVEIINTAIPQVSVFIISVIMFLILLGVFGIKVTPQNWGTGVFVLLAMVVVFLIFGSSAGWFDAGLPSWLSFLNDPDVQALVLVGIMFFVVVTLVTGPSGNGKFKDDMRTFFNDNFGGI